MNGLSDPDMEPLIWPPSTEPRKLRSGRRRREWVALVNGRFACTVEAESLKPALARLKSDAVALYVDSAIAAGREKIIRASDATLAGIRRYYHSTAYGSPVDDRCEPHYLLVRAQVWETLAGSLRAVHAFDDLPAALVQSGVAVRGLRLGGAVRDMDTTQGLLEVMRLQLRGIRPAGNFSGQGRTVGPVLCGQGVRIERGALVAGPAVLCDGAFVGGRAFVADSVIGRNAEVAPGRVIRGRVVFSGTDGEYHALRRRLPRSSTEPAVFRRWPLLSYPRTVKRAADIVCSLAVLTLFAAVLPVIAAVIKISSPGPVFFAHIREGRHGRKFKCLKFRTMHMGSDDMQDKLRRVNQVDGPQFKIENDPRTTRIGDFLRKTSIDEIPQFINVLLGQMSVVGPRPSPESENARCPAWRDARLSVRPGITGLWQINRTRLPGRDFQEWLFWDTTYVRELSPRMDMWLCIKTFQKLITDFLRQF